MPDVKLPEDDTERKAAPMYRALFAPFAWALFQIAKHGARWNDKHHPPGSPITLKSRRPDEHVDALLRHVAGAADGGASELEHRTAIAWRGLAQLQAFGLGGERWGVFYAGERSRTVLGTFDTPEAAKSAIWEACRNTSLDPADYSIQRLP